LCAYACACVGGCEIGVHVLKAVTRTSKICSLLFSRYAVVVVIRTIVERRRFKWYTDVLFGERSSTDSAVRCDVMCDRWYPQLNKLKL
jgi:hypothetical protein